MDIILQGYRLIVLSSCRGAGYRSGLWLGDSWDVGSCFPLALPGALGSRVVFDSEFFRGSIFRHSRDMRTSELKYGDEAAKSSDIICMKKCTYI